MSPDLVFDPELRLLDGTVIRTREDAIAFARAQQPRPGADERDAVLHQLERASRPEEAEAAGRHFRSWLARLALLPERI